MKLLIGLLISVSAFAQAVRVDPSGVFTVSGTVPPGSYAPVLAVPGSRIQICTYPSCGSPVTTYTDATAGTACASTAPLVLAGTSTCVSSTDRQGNWGFWVLPGLYSYKVTFPNGSVYGPYAITAASVGASGPTGPTAITGGNQTLETLRGLASQVLSIDSWQWPDGTQTWVAANPTYNGIFIADLWYAIHAATQISAAQVNAIARKFASLASNSTHDIPISIGLNGTSTSFISGCDTTNWHATGDGDFLTPLLYLNYYQRTNDISQFNADSAILKAALGSIPRDATTGLVNIPNATPWMPWGFHDGITNTGFDLMGSLLDYQASLAMAALYTANRDSTSAALFTAAAAKTKLALATTGPLWNAGAGMYNSATINNNQIDILGSAFAVYLGVTSSAQTTAISQYLVTNYPSITSFGYVRQSPATWANVNACTTSSNTYDNGSWSVGNEWVSYAMRQTSTATAMQLVTDFLSLGVTGPLTPTLREYYQQGVGLAGVTSNMESPMGTFAFVQNNPDLYLITDPLTSLIPSAGGIVGNVAAMAGGGNITDAGQISAPVIAPPAPPTVTPTCTGTCASTYGYRVYAILPWTQPLATTALSVAATTAVQASTLSVSNYNSVTINCSTGVYGLVATYYLKRSTSPGTTGYIWSGPCNSVVADTGLTATSSSDPTTTAGTATLQSLSVVNNEPIGSLTQAFFANKYNSSSGHSWLDVVKGASSAAAATRYWHYSGGSPVCDWEPGVHDDLRYSIRDCSTGNKVIEIQQGAPAGALSVDSSGNVAVNTGTTVIYRCTGAGTLRVGQLTSVSADCGTSVDSGLRTK